MLQISPSLIMQERFGRTLGSRLCCQAQELRMYDSESCNRQGIIENFGTSSRKSLGIGFEIESYQHLGFLRSERVTI